MIKIKLGNLVVCRPILDRIAQQNLPIKTSYGLAKIIKAVNSEFEFFEKQRISLCQTYGKANEATQSYDITDNTFYTKYDELVNMEVEISEKPIINTDEIIISAKELMIIEPFIVVDDEVETE